MRRAAEEAAAKSAAIADRDEGFLDEACRSGALISTASPKEIATLRGSFARVYRMMERNPVTKAFLEEIQVLKRSTPPGPEPSIPAGCQSISSG